MEKDEPINEKDQRQEEVSHYQKEREKERPDMSSWSGASAGGGVWAGFGRTRHEESRSR